MGFLKLIFGGSFGYVQAGLIGIVGIALLWTWRDYQGAKEDVTKLKADVVKLEGKIASKDGVINSMAKSASRRQSNNQQSRDLGNDIQNAKDGNACARSEPIRIALDGLRLDAAAGSVDATAEPLPMLAGADPAKP